MAGVPTATAAAAAAGAAGAAAAGAAVIGMMWDDVVLATMPAATTVSGVAVRLERLCVTNASSSSPTPAGVDGVNGGGGGGGGGGDGVWVEGARGVLYADSCAFSGSPRQGVKWRDICATASCPHNGGCGVGAYGPGVRLELRRCGMRVCGNDMAGLSAVGGARIHCTPTPSAMCSALAATGSPGTAMEEQRGMVTVAAEGKEHDDKNNRVHKLSGKGV